ncbi:MAG: FAD binding domain-containing protein [Spirochaetales bacterium]|nr:FAD binding domain-containing protein [Spirochaetales bacterium]
MDLIDVQTVVRPRSETEIPPWRAGDAYVAGGTWLFSEEQPGVTRLIDLSTIEVEPLSGDERTIRIAATCTYRELLGRMDRLGTAGPLFVHAIDTLSSSFKTWEVATVGGNVCLAYAKSMMAPVCCLLGATYELAAPAGTTRMVPAESFQIGVCETILRPGEYLREIRIPREACSDRYALEKMSYTPTSHATAMAIARKREHASRNAEGAPGARIVLSAATEYPVCVPISAAGADEEVERAVDAVCSAHPLLDDGHGSAVYRHHMLRVAALRAWRRLDDGNAR